MTSVHSQLAKIGKVGLVIGGLALAIVASTGVAASQTGEPTEMPGRWESVPKAPWGAQFPDAFAVDGDVIVMDRFGSGRLLRYGHDSRGWTRLPRVPEPIKAIGPSVWTGEEFVVFDALEPDGVMALDPDSGAWHSLPASPLAGHDFATAGGGRVAAIHVESSDGFDLERALAILDPASGEWAELPPPTGEGALIDIFGWDGGLMAVTDDENRSIVQVQSLDFETGSWREPQVVPVPSYPARAVWAGDRLVWSGDDSVVGGADASYDPATRTVADEEFDCQLTTRAAEWTGEFLISTIGNSALDPKTGDCFRLPGRNRTMGGSAAVVWTGDRIVYWSGGGAEEGAPDPFRLDGFAFVPDPLVTAD